MRKTGSLALAFMSVSLLASGGSYQLNLQGLRQVAMGGSGVAWPWDVSAIFYNPGALSRLDGLQVYANAFAVSPRVRYEEALTGVYTAEAHPKRSVPFAVYAGGTVKKGGKLGVGLGVYTPFGSSINWGDDWRGRYIVQSIALSSIFVQPTVSYRVNDIISVGAGFVYGSGTVEIHKAIPLQDMDGNDGRSVLKGRAHGVGFNVGAQVKATGKLQFGASYRSGVRMKVKDGNASFDVASSLVTSFPNTSFSTELPLPGILTIGAGYRVTKKLVVQGDVVFAGWHTYDSLRFEFKENTTALRNTSEPRNYSNTIALRLGAHYNITPALAVMAGGAYDPSPVSDDLLAPDAVDADRLSLSCGVSYIPVRNVSVIAALNYTATPQREAFYAPANFHGVYQIKSLVPALAVSYKF